jgi:2-polyprenyl-6-methoxyphenol hydroxylase-like FAD-dependent oxidoreductase
MVDIYDVIVVGARCAGSPVAMLLAQRGYRVLVVDRTAFPSDTMSTHLVHPPGVAALHRWGQMEALAATGCPPIRTYLFDCGTAAIAGTPLPADGISDAYCPRRTVLDELLANAAVNAGAQLRERFTVDELVFDDGRVAGIRGRGPGNATTTERGRVVVGADGRHSTVSRVVGACGYHEKPPFGTSYYAYWSGVPVEGFEAYTRPGRLIAAAPTHDDLTMVVVGSPASELAAIRADVEGSFLTSLELAPGLAARVAAGQRQGAFRGTGDLPSYFRHPYGPGWALVGDAGYHKDPCTAQGISDAFRDAELLAAALDDALAGRRDHDEAMAGYQRARDTAATPMFDLTCQIARLEDTSREMRALLVAMQGNRAAADGFVSVLAGTVPIAEFFRDENLARIMAAAGTRAARP